MRTLVLSVVGPEHYSTIAFFHKLIAIRVAYSALLIGSCMTLHTDDANNTYAFGCMDQQNRIAVILNQDSRSHSVAIPVYQVSMTDGSSVTDQLTGNTYQVQNG